MISIKYQFRKSSGSIQANVNFGYVECASDGKRTYRGVRLSTGLSCESKEAMHKLIDQKDRGLVEFESKIHAAHNLLKVQGEDITPESLKETICKLLGRTIQVKPKAVGVSEYARDAFIKGKSAGTQRQYRSLAHLITLYEKQKHKGKVLTSENMSKQIYLDFLSFFENKVVTGSGDEKAAIEGSKSNNTQWNLQKRWRAVLRDMKRTVAPDIWTPELLTKSERTTYVQNDFPVLTWEEIGMIVNHRPGCERLENVRNITLILLFSACRISDAYKVMESVIQSDGILISEFYLHKKVRAQPVPVSIPLLGPLVRLYENEIQIRQISSVKFNRYLKELFREIGLNRQVSLSRTSGNGYREIISKPLHEWATSHIGRRTHISLALGSGKVAPIILAQVTGHALPKNGAMGSLFSYSHQSARANAKSYLELIEPLIEPI